MSRRPQPLPDPVPSLGGFEGIINAKRREDYGYGALTVGRNVEVTDTKKLVRRNGFASIDTGGYAALYGARSRQRLLAVKAGALLHVAPNGTPTMLHTGLIGDAFSWDEDPANNIYYTSSGGDNGIVLAENIWLPLALAQPEIRAVYVVETAPWEVRPLNLGKKYDENTMQLMATYVYPDGRESAPSMIVSVTVAPEVKLLRMEVPALAGCVTYVYATAPGGSTYYLVSASEQPVFTFPVYMVTQNYRGPDYHATSILDSFPVAADQLAMYAGRLFAAHFDHDSGLGVVYGSQLLQYHLFDKLADMFQVSGEPRLLLTCKDGMVVGTHSNIYVYRAPKQGLLQDGQLDQVASYGVPPGVCGEMAMDGTGWFWTERGIAKAVPYQLVTEGRFYGDPGVFNHARIFYDRGYAKLVASTVAGAPVFNEWEERT